MQVKFCQGCCVFALSRLGCERTTQSRRETKISACYRRGGDDVQRGLCLRQLHSPPGSHEVRADSCRCLPPLLRITQGGSDTAPHRLLRTRGAWHGSGLSPILRAFESCSFLADASRCMTVFDNYSFAKHRKDRAAPRSRASCADAGDRDFLDLFTTCNHAPRRLARCDASGTSYAQRATESPCRATLLPRLCHEGQRARGPARPFALQRPRACHATLKCVDRRGERDGLAGRVDRRS